MSDPLIEELRKLGIPEFELITLNDMIQSGTVELESFYDEETGEATLIFREKS